MEAARGKEEAGRKTRRALYRLAKTLRYRTLTELIGQRFELTSLAMIEAQVRDLLGARLARGSRLRQPDPELAENALMKYGIIDAEMDADVALLEHPETVVGLDVMRECGFLPKRGELWNHEERSFGVALADDLEETSIEGGCVIKLMINDDLTDEARWATMTPAQTKKGGTAKGYLPRMMEVRDACVVTSSLIWFHRYFYL